MPTSNHESLLSSLTLLWEPEEWISSVSESVRLEAGLLVRDVEITYRLPDLNLSDHGLVAVDIDSSAMPVDSGEARNYFVPLMREPRKGSIVDVSNLRRGDGSNVRLVSHNEHLDCSVGMIASRFVQTVSTFAPIEGEAFDSHLEALTRIPWGTPKEARTELERIFDTKSGQLRRWNGEFRPSDERRLYRLCAMLVERYPLIAKVSASPGDELRLSYRVTEAYAEAVKGVLKPFRYQFGAIPSRIDIPLPLARRTNNYRFRMNCPRGLYFYDACMRRDDGAQLEDSDLYSSHSGSNLAMTTKLFGANECLAHIHNGSRYGHRVGISLTIYEVPPGATLFAWVVSLVSLFVCGGIGLVVGGATPNESFDTAALVVAIAAAAPLVAGPFLPRSEMFDSPLLARAALLASGVLSSSFAIWILVYDAEISPGGDWSSLLEWWSDRGGWISVGLMSIVFLLLTNRVLSAMAAYREILARGSSSVTVTSGRVR